jgi:hypothetical protein
MYFRRFCSGRCSLDTACERLVASVLLSGTWFIPGYELNLLRQIDRTAIAVQSVQHDGSGVAGVGRDQGEASLLRGAREPTLGEEATAQMQHLV